MAPRSRFDGLFLRSCRAVFAAAVVDIPDPPVGRTSPAAAGFPEAEEHILTTRDGEKVIIWYVPAKPGHPVVWFFHGNGDFLAGRVNRFAASPLRAPV
jgi:acyl-CoA synthetase (AMP-forming)/AMP-acid ligase II